MISIIIIVKNDRGIENTLLNLKKIKKPSKTEIIVVDSSVGTLDDIRDKFLGVRWIPFIPGIDKKITIPEQRNVGIKSAKGEIIVFTDAGCIPEEKWLANLINPILNGEEQVTAGAFLSLREETIHDQAYYNNRSKRYILESPTMNMAFSKSIFNIVGLFDESFEGGEDIDICWRLQDSGIKIRYLPNAKIYHDWGDLKNEIHRSFFYGTSKARLYLKHRNKIKNLLSNDIYILIYTLFILGLPITLIIPYYPLILLIPIMKNINKKPFHTLLDHLIYSLGVIFECIINVPYRYLKKYSCIQ